MASTYSSSVRSSAKVSCWLKDFCGSRAGNQRALINAVGELPDVTACRPSTSSSISIGVAAMWRISASPAAFNRALVFGPMPGSQRFGRG